MASILYSLVWASSGERMWVSRHPSVSSWHPHRENTQTDWSRYWDWSIDSKDIRASPVWDAQRGFGGDGEHLGNITVSHGRCVMDGPFANTTRHWQSKKIGDDYYTIVNPHCFSRGFITQEPRLHSLLRGISPHNIQDLLDEGNYREFFQRLELSIHNSIPLIINGDFASLTAPNGKSFQILVFCNLWKYT